MTDPQYVEDHVDPTEPTPELRPEVPGWRTEPLPGEPAEAIAWRVLAETRVDAARLAWQAPEPGPPTSTGPRIVARRADLPPEATHEPAERPGPSWMFGARCLWRDPEAFLAKIPRRDSGQAGASLLCVPVEAPRSAAPLPPPDAR